MLIKIIPNDTRRSPGVRLADAEIHFDTGSFAGLKLIGFAVWPGRTNPDARTVTFPARDYTVNGEKRRYALLRPQADTTQQDRLRDLILSAYAAHEADAAREIARRALAQAERESLERTARETAEYAATHRTPHAPATVTDSMQAAAEQIAKETNPRRYADVVRTSPEQATADVAAGKPILLSSLIPQRQPDQELTPDAAITELRAVAQRVAAHIDATPTTGAKRLMDLF